MSPSSSAIARRLVGILLDDEDFVVGLDELLREMEADLPAADDDDVDAVGAGGHTSSCRRNSCDDFAGRLVGRALR